MSSGSRLQPVLPYAEIFKKKERGRFRCEGRSSLGAYPMRTLSTLGKELQG